MRRFLASANQATMNMFGYVMAVLSEDGHGVFAANNVFLFKPIPSLNWQDTRPRSRSKKGDSAMQVQPRRKRSKTKDTADEDDEDEEPSHSSADSAEFAPIRLVGRLPSYSPLVRYQLQVQRNSINSPTFRLEHILHVEAPEFITIAKLKTICNRCIEQAQVHRNHNITPTKIDRIRAFWSTRDANGKFVTQGNTQIKSQEQLLELGNEDVKTLIRDFRIADNLFMSPTFYHLFRFLPMRSLARPSDSGGALQRFLFSIVRNPARWLLATSLSEKDMTFQRISIAGYRELLGDKAKPDVIAARVWIDDTFRKVHQFGQTRFRLPEDPRLVEVLEGYDVIQKEPGGTCVLGCAAKAAREIVDRLRAIPKCCMVTATAVASGMAEISAFCNDEKEKKKKPDGKYSSVQQQQEHVLIVAATPMARHYLNQRLVGHTVYSAQSLMSAESERLNAKQSANKMYTKLVVYAAEQFSLYSLHAILKYPHFQSAMLVMDIRRLPGSPVLGSGWPVGDIIQSDCFKLTAAAPDPADAFALPKELFDNMSAVLQQDFAKMRVQTTYSETNGVFLVDPTWFDNWLKHLNHKPTAIEPFKWQVLCESKEIRDGVHKTLFGPAFEDTKVFVPGQTMALPDNPTVWYVLRTFQKGPPRLNVPFATVDKQQLGMTVQIEHPNRIVDQIDVHIRHGFFTINCEFVSRNVRGRVPLVFYVLDRERSSSRSIYTAMQCSLNRFVLVGSQSDLNAILARSSTGMERLRVSLSSYAGDTSRSNGAASEDLKDLITMDEERQKNMELDGGPMEMLLNENDSSNDKGDSKSEASSSTPPPLRERPRKKAKHSHPTPAVATAASSATNDSDVVMLDDLFGDGF